MVWCRDRQKPGAVADHEPMVSTRHCTSAPVHQCTSALQYFGALHQCTTIMLQCALECTLYSCTVYTVLPILPTWLLGAVHLLRQPVFGFPGPPPQPWQGYLVTNCQHFPDPFLHLPRSRKQSFAFKFSQPPFPLHQNIALPELQIGVHQMEQLWILWFPMPKAGNYSDVQLTLLGNWIRLTDKLFRKNWLFF